MADQQTITIRLAEEADVEIIFDIRTSVTENHMSREMLQELGITPEPIREEVDRAPCAWVAEINGVPAGFAMVDQSEGSVFALFVRPGLEGRGLGQRLLLEAERALFSQYEAIWLTTDAATRAAWFYEKMGWVAVDTLADGQIRFEKRRLGV